MEERIFGEYKIRLYYVDCDNKMNEHRYFVECVDMKMYVVMIIDSNVIDKTSSISMEDAIAKTKNFFRVRFNDFEYWETFSRP